MLLLALAISTLPSCSKLDELRSERERIQAATRDLQIRGQALDQTLSQMKITSASSSGLFGLNQQKKRSEADLAVLRADITDAEVRLQSLQLEVEQLQGEADYFRALLSPN